MTDDELIAACKRVAALKIEADIHKAALNAARPTIRKWAADMHAKRMAELAEVMAELRAGLAG